MQLWCYSGHILCCFDRRDRVCLHLHSHYFLYRSHMSFFDMFFNGCQFYPQPLQLSVHGLWIDISINSCFSLVLDLEFRCLELLVVWMNPGPPWSLRKISTFFNCFLDKNEEIRPAVLTKLKWGFKSSMVFFFFFFFF